MNSKSFIRVVEFLYALKLMIAVSKRLKPGDLIALEKIVDEMEMLRRKETNK